MPGNVFVDTQKLQSIKDALQQFNVAMQINSSDLISYIADKKYEVESNLRRKLERFEENEIHRHQAEASADEDTLFGIREENSRQRQQEMSELNDLKSLIKAFGTISDELEYHLRKLAGVHSDTLSKGASTLSKCIQIMDEYFAVSFPGVNSFNSTQNKTGGSGNSRTGIPPAKQMRNFASGWASKLNAQQKEAIYDYTKEIPPYYKNINGVLRGHQNAYEYGNEERSELIHSALSQASTPCDITVYRGCSSDVLGELAYASDEEVVGGVFIDKGYASTSMSHGLAFDGDLLLEIHLPEGSHAANIESLSAAGRYEEEVLIDRGQVFQIVGAHRDETGRRVIEVNAIN